MRIACPHCQAIYEVASADPDVGFLCSRCHNEFYIDKYPEGKAGIEVNPDIQPGLFDTDMADPSQPLFHLHSTDSNSVLRPPLFLENMDPIDDLPLKLGVKGKEEPQIQDIVQEASLPNPPATEKVDDSSEHPDSHTETPTSFEEEHHPTPERQAPRILTWMSWVMLVIAVSGFVYNHASWSENLWLRSLMLNLHFPINVHASDWRIPPKSVHAEWIKRDNGSSVLVIEGKIENRLHAELPTPWIQVTVFDALHSNETVRRKTMAITLPPAVDAIEHAPWVSPPLDKMPVAAASSRGFVLVMDKLPKQAGEFTLDVVPSLFR